jgi:hypothetical protein
MTDSAVTAKPAPAKNTSFSEVFAVRAFRAPWLAQPAPIAGDQFACAAATVLVYDRTRSALLAVVTFAASIVPMFVGCLTPAWMADRYPRRTVMITCDLISLALVLEMIIPARRWPSWSSCCSLPR